MSHFFYINCLQILITYVLLSIKKVFSFAEHEVHVCAFFFPISGNVNKLHSDL